jgi:two-component system response regulator WspF
MPLRIAIVHHDLATRQRLHQILSLEAGHTVVWTAGKAQEAVRRCRDNRPDILLADLDITDTDGVRFICDVMEQTPCAILVLTNGPNAQAAKVFEAMGCGALDAIATPGHGGGTSREEGAPLLKKVATITKLLGQATPSTRDNLKGGTATEPLPPLVAIGSSTGGPKALATILSAFPANFKAAVVVCQHVDLQFAQGLTEWLNAQTALEARLVQEGMRPRPGVVHVAGTNDHLVLGEDLAYHYTVHPREYPYRPSVNALFASLCKFWPRKDTAVLLTGMGRDGGEGLAALRKAGWHTIAQDERTSIVYGMPAAAAELGGAASILPLERIAEAILERIKGGSG